MRSREPEAPYVTAVGMEMFCELQKGAVDFIGFSDALREIKYSVWAIVEQDMYPAPFDKPLLLAKRNPEYLCEIGIG